VKIDPTIPNQEPEPKIDPTIPKQEPEPKIDPIIPKQEQEPKPKPWTCIIIIISAVLLLCITVLCFVFSSNSGSCGDGLYFD